MVITIVGMETQLYWSTSFRPWHPISKIDRVIFYYSFFTVLSNIMLAIGCAILIFKPKCSTTWFRVIRLCGLSGILITAIVYNIVLRPIHHPVPIMLLQVANECLHVIIPALGMLTWLIYGPFPRIDLKTIFYSFLVLSMYGVYIFVRGYLTGLYPYPFINVNQIGYEKALLACLAIVVLFLGIVALLKFIEWLRIRKW